VQTTMTWVRSLQSHLGVSSGSNNSSSCSTKLILLAHIYPFAHSGQYSVCMPIIAQGHGLCTNVLPCCAHSRCELVPANAWTHLETKIDVWKLDLREKGQWWAEAWGGKQESSGRMERCLHPPVEFKRSFPDDHAQTLRLRSRLRSAYNPIWVGLVEKIVFR